MQTEERKKTKKDEEKIKKALLPQYGNNGPEQWARLESLGKKNWLGQHSREIFKWAGSFLFDFEKRGYDYPHPGVEIFLLLDFYMNL